MRGHCAEGRRGFGKGSLADIWCSRATPIHTRWLRAHLLTCPCMCVGALSRRQCLERPSRPWISNQIVRNPMMNTESEWVVGFPYIP